MTHLDAEALFATLVAQMRDHVGADTALVGIHTGGVWLAERLHQALGLTQPLGSIDVSYYRDDFATRAKLGSARRSEIPFAVDGAHVIIVDDVLYTGRTTRAALNELFDYGRPAKVELAVLVDRGGRELPIMPQYCAHRTDPLPAHQILELQTTDDGQLTLRLIDA